MVRVSTNPLRGWSCILATLLLAVGLAAPALAQTDVTTSRISGTVEGADKAPLPGVTIEATNTETGLTIVGVTDAAGFYRVLNLPTGTYKISAALDGFATATAENVRLLIGSTPTVNFTLQSSTVAETITVTSEVPIVEQTNTAQSTTIQREQIDAIASNNRDFKNFVYLTPQSSRENERGTIALSGQRGLFTNVTIDGVDFNDGFFGGTVGAAEGRAPLSISQESIKEFSVITNGASVEFGRSGGGFVNVVTKGGSNNLHASGFYYYQPQSLIADFPNGAQAADQKKDEFGASLGGKLIPDKLFYFLSYDKVKQNVTVPIQGNILDPDIFAKYPVLSSPSSYVQGRNGDVKFGRVDYQVTPAQRLMLRGNFTKYDGPNGTGNTTTRTASYNGIEGLDSKSYVGQWSGQFGANVLNDLNLNNVKEDTPRADKGLNLPEIQLSSNGGRYGEVSFLPIVSTTKRKAFGDTLSFLLDKHVIKAGGEYNDTSIDQVFKGNWRGVFVFNNKADFLAGRWFQYRQFGGLNGLTSDQAGRAAFSQKETALFLQDQWFLAPNLTLSAGIRWEQQDNPNNPVLNRFDQNANGSFKLNTQIPDAKNQLSPRLSISWAPDEKTALRASVGRYWARTPAILFAQPFTSNGLQGTQFTITAQNTGGVVTGPPTSPLSPGWGDGVNPFNPQGVERIDFTKIPTPSRLGVFTVDRNFDNPYVDRLSIGGEREILGRTSVGFDFTYAKGHQLQRLRDVNRQYDGTTSSNGLPHYSSTVFPYPFYGVITESVSDGRSQYTALTGTLRRRFTENFNIYAAVTYSKDKDNDSNERNFAGIQAEDFNNLDNNYGYSARDRRWKSVINSVWNTPWWGITLSGAYRYYTGEPYSALVGVDVNGDGQSGTDRPTINGQHLARNSFRQPDQQTLDLRVAKRFAVGPGGLTLFAECFNCVDSANRRVTNTTWGTGQTPNAAFGQAIGVTDPVIVPPRTFQFAVRYEF
jgi:hypothetical protein